MKNESAGFERVEVGPGLRLAVRHRAPQGRDVGATFLLVHGLASNALLWDGVAEALAAAGRPSIAVDLRGHGRSDKPDDGYDVGTVADDLASLVGNLGLDRPIAVGQSWGGNVVVELGRRHPGLLAGVAGVDGGLIELREQFAGWEACASVLAPPRLVGRPLRDVEAYLAGAHPDWPAGGIAGTLGNFEVRPDGTIAPWLTFERHMRVLRGLWDHRPSAFLAGYPLPLSLLVVGDPGGRGLDDDLDGWTAAKRRGVERAEGLAPRVRTRWFPGADHDVHAQLPDAVAAELLAAEEAGFFAPVAGAVAEGAGAAAAAETATGRRAAGSRAAGRRAAGSRA